MCVGDFWVSGVCLVLGMVYFDTCVEGVTFRFVWLV